VVNVTIDDEQVEVELSKRADRNNIFKIHRFKDGHGLQVYSLENAAEGNKIFIPRFIFDRFRACVKTIVDHELPRRPPASFELTVPFLNQDYFIFKSSSADIENLIIQDIEEREGSSGYLTVSRRCLQALEQLLYNEKLQHPNDVLKEIIAYHKLFQFSFVKGSKSITSALALRKDVLQHTERYHPRLAERVLVEDAAATEGKKTKARSAPAKGAGLKAETLFARKLGERFNEKNIQVDYEEVFGDTKISLSPAVETDESSSAKRKSILSEIAVPLSANDVKAFETGKFYFELSPVESSVFRNKFIDDRHSDFYLGFEIVDTLFTFNRSIRSFRFPLYYTKVRIRESGRGVHLESRQQGLIYLNHLALAQLVEKFSETSNGVDPVDEFFKTLLAQDVSVDRLNDRVRLARYLPVKENIFDRTREILFGYADENGKGGILSDLKFKGLECDLNSVFLYRAPKLLSPIDQALEFDLDKINTIAYQSMPRFYSSLLGQFLTPERQPESAQSREFAPIMWMPGALSQSTRKLMDGLNHHDLVLLEGPPGTGKTHTIMNLLIHCINSRKRVLIVSDQQAAIEALVEKLQEYLVGDDKGSPAERKWKELLFSAVKVIDEVEMGEQTLPGLVANLTKTFKVQELSSGVSGKSENIEKHIKDLTATIEHLVTLISKKMMGYMGESTTFDNRVPPKGEAAVDIPSLLEFLGLLLGKKTPDRKLIDAFVHGRFQLIQEDMEDCYSFFKIPAKNFDNEVKTLQQDESILASILETKPDSIEAFHALTSEYPRHEIIRFLEAIVQQQYSHEGSPLTRLARMFRAIFRSPLQIKTKMLLQEVQQQIALLKKAGNWSDGLWDLLRDMHEAIRVGNSHCRALGLYRSIDSNFGVEVGVDPTKSASIQGDLEQIDDLYQQRDEIVKDRFVENLREIVDQATRSKKQSGTNNITSIMALVDDLKQFNSISESGSVFEELRQKLFETFPIWVVRKQMVPFILPCTEQSIDLVIVDEATQCRVDDAMSLMFRAKKMLVVGDDRQTVLQKNSVIDDYLFKDHELDEHLRSTQARGFKGGGSNVFALIQSIKQASVMLDEHYRCPADIIEFSNKYVYDGELNVMQWSLPEHPESVIVDYSEQKIESSRKPTSGKFKGIETEMLERFFDYVVSTVKKLEKSTGKKINVETDVALCYFLLKNEPYVKFIKGKYLQKLNRGEDILDGAGAALQGKERDYIFYFWDITRHNLGAFKQGDSADKRKGELNVLMSRPKRKAFHYLHRSFDQIEHGRTDISSYLWRCYLQQENQKNSRRFNVDNSPGDSLLAGLLRFTLGVSSKRGIKELSQNVQAQRIDFRDQIAVGDARRVVDLIAFPANTTENIVGLVDLSGFGCESQVGQAIVDYFFQLKRAAPRIDPVFTFAHELIDENCQTFRSLAYKLEQLDLKTTEKKARVS